MARTATKVGIWNRALHRIGETQLVESEDEAGSAAEACRVHYDDVLEEVLAAAPWPFARRQSALSVPAGVTRTGWEFVYTVPGDCVMPLALLAEGERIGSGIRRKYETQGQYLLANEDDFEVLEYTSLVTDVTEYPRGFVDALVWRLAPELAMALKKDPNLAGALLQQYRAALRTAAAQAMNSQEFEAEPATPSVAARS